MSLAEIGNQSRTGDYGGVKHAVASLSPALFLLLAFFWIPLAGTVLASFRRAGEWDLGAYRELTGGAFPSILAATVGDSAAVTIACVVLGSIAAYALARMESRWVSILLVIVTVPLFVSSLIRSYAWVAILGNRGMINQFLLATGSIDRPIKLAYTQIGMIVAMIQVQLPMFILPAYSVMRRIDPRIRRAAQSLGADPITAFVTTFLPPAAPGVAVAAVLVFIGSLGFFETPALLGPPGAYLISQSIEVRVNSLGDQPGAAAQAIVLLILTMLMLGIATVPARRSMGERDVGPRSGSTQFRRRTLVAAFERAARVLAPWRWAIVGPLASFVLALSVMPLVILFPLAFSAASYLSFPPESYSIRWFVDYFASRERIAGTVYSFQLAFTAALVATVAGTVAVLSFDKLPIRVRIGVMGLAAAPLIVSPMVLAVSVYNIAAWLGLLGTPASFVGTYALMGLPYPILIVTAALFRLDPALSRAATSLGARPFAVLRTVTLPLLSSAVASAFLFAFVTAFNDLSVSLFLSSSTMRTLPLLMWDELRQEITPRLAVVAVVVLVVGGAFCAVTSSLRSLIIHRRKRRFGSRAALASCRSI
ncbi:ABC transporter permease subunit [Rhizobium brockwellii]|uniref:ABC transporter permease subunit n=1 Tax=Rhizobium brockwellii TaxID=3019932 RepID=UPI003F948F61